MSFPLLSDAQGEVIKRYGLEHPNAVPGFDRPVARPAVFILDRGRVVRERYLTGNWRIRVRPERILMDLRKLSS